MLREAHGKRPVREETQEVGLLLHGPVRVAGSEPMSESPAAIPGAGAETEAELADRVLDRGPAGRVEEEGVEGLPRLSEGEDLRFERPSDGEDEGHGERAGPEVEPDGAPPESGAFAEPGARLVGVGHGDDSPPRLRLDEGIGAGRHAGRGLPDGRRRLVDAAIAGEAKDEGGVERSAGRAPAHCRPGPERRSSASLALPHPRAPAR